MKHTIVALKITPIWICTSSHIGCHLLDWLIGPNVPGPTKFLKYLLEGDERDWGSVTDTDMHFILH